MSYVLPLCLVIIACSQGYYWKDWQGSIPIDAFIAGSDPKGKAYIAQVYVPNNGVYVGHIFSNQQKVSVVTDVYSRKPAAVLDINLKILCTDRKDLYWTVSNVRKTKQMITTDKGKRLVKGGVTDKQSPIYIGKYFNTEKVFVGSVHGDYEEVYYVYYSADSPSTSTFYEILMSEES